MTDRAALLDAGRAYLERWSAWLRENPDADAGMVQSRMSQGEPPPDIAVLPTDSNAVTAWAAAHPAAYRVYWLVRAALEDKDGKTRATHHRVAILLIHDAFGSKPERARLGLPATALELASMLGVTDRALRQYRYRYASIFGVARAMLKEAFITHYYGQVFEALGETALRLGPQGAADRRLFMQLANELTDRVRVDDWRSDLVDAIRKGEILPEHVRELYPDIADALIREAGV